MNEKQRRNGITCHGMETGDAVTLLPEGDRGAGNGDDGRQARMALPEFLLGEA
jgi:hypothetical protein